MSVVIETTIGDLTIDLYLKDRPKTCMNFLKLCKIKYYNLCLFHKIEKNFIAQSGDPSGTGRGGESVFCHLYGDQAKYFESEFKPRLKHSKLGTISMVNNGQNMNGSQFFLTLGENLTYLDEDHTVFGEVVEGFTTLLKLNEAICDEKNRPYQDIRITHTVVLHDPCDDPSGLDIPDASPEPTREQLESAYIAADEEIDDTQGKTTEEIEERIKESEAKARATILEMVGDIPDADVKPPENVLFVCKLNPVTTSEDLEVIFSRFGKILSCEVIKDRKTEESLQYAFIEFEKEEDCENAYFKMDNVLIDDRRIHVDFSQSVSKLNWSKDGKFLPYSKAPKSNVVLKNAVKKSDGYDLIFDLNSPKDEMLPKRSKLPDKKYSHTIIAKAYKRRDRSRSKSPQRLSSTASKNSRHRERSRSKSPDRLNSYKKYPDKDKSDFSQNRRRQGDLPKAYSKYSDSYDNCRDQYSKSSTKFSYSSKRAYESSGNDKKSYYQESSKNRHSISPGREKRNAHTRDSSNHSNKSHRYSIDRKGSKELSSSKREKSYDVFPENRKQSHSKKSSNKRSSSVSSSSSSSSGSKSKKISSESSSSTDSSIEKRKKKDKKQKKLRSHSVQKVKKHSREYR